MSASVEDISQAIVRLVQDTETLHDFVHGPDTETVETESGELPTVSKLVKDLREEVSSITTEAVAAASAAGISASEAESQAEAARLSAVDAANALSAIGDDLEEAALKAQEAEAAASASAQSAGSAASSASAASNASNAADTSATTAQNAADAASDYVAKLLAPSSTHPLTRANGSPLQEGDEYQNTGDHQRYSWSGTAWIAINSAAQSLEAALADATDPAKNAALVGFYDSAAPAYLKTTSDILNMEPVNVLRLVPKTLHAALHNGTGTFPLAAPLNGLISAMSAAGGGEIVLTYGKHMLENYVEMLSNVGMSGLGDNSVLKGMFPSAINRMLTSPAAVLQRNIHLRKFKLDRSVANTQHGIILGGIDGLTIDDVSIDGVGVGGAMGISPFDEFAAVQSRNVDIKNCRINTPNNFGIAFGNVSGGTITNNLFSDAYREAIGLECWGNTSAVEDVVVSGNILRMNTRAGNHVGGSVGPAILVGGAGHSYGGVTRRCKLANNVITIDNVAGLTSYGGIFVIGGTADAYAAEDIDIVDNTVYNAPAQGMNFGALGSFTRRVTTRGNRLINPNNANTTYSAIQLRNAQDCVMVGDVIIGNKHVYSVFEDVSSSGNTFLDIIPGTPTTDKLLRNGVAAVAAIYRDPTTNQVLGGRQFQESKSIANNATVTYTPRTNPNRGLYMLVASNGAYAILSIVSTAVPVVIAKSIDVVVGATDPGNAGAFSVFPFNSTSISVTNRIGASHNVTLLSLNAN